MLHKMHTFTLLILPYAAAQPLSLDSAQTVQLEEAWALDYCSGYTVGSSAAAKAAEVSSYFGASDTDFTAPIDRVGLLLEIIDYAIETCIEYPDSCMNTLMDQSGYAATQFTTYVNQAAGSQAAPIVLAGFVVLIWLPLWITRCCPHKCCKPRHKKYEFKDRAITGGCCSFWWLLVLIISLAALGAGGEAFEGFKFSMCGTIYMVQSSRSFFTNITTQVSGMRAELNATLVSVTGIEAAIAPILTALDSNGAVATSCGYISTCLASINAIEADVSTATGGTSALATSAELSAAKTALDMATSAMCNQRASLSSSASSASSGLSGAKGVLTGINTMFGFITAALDAIVAGLDDVVRETIYGNRMANEFLPMVLGGISLLISMPILLYLGGSFLGSCCLVLCAKPRNPATQEERKCCHKCGSCFTCFSWFGFSAGVIITLLGSFGALVMATVVTDFGSLFLYIPRSPQTALGPVCDALSFNISDSGRRIDGCGIVSGCFATPSTDLFTAVEQPLGLSDFVNITSSMDTSAFATPPVNASFIAAMIADAQSVSVPASLSAATFGIPTSSALYSQVNTHITTLRTDSIQIAPPLSSLPTLTTNLVASITTTLTAVDRLIADVQSFLTDAPQTFTCEWMRIGLDAVIMPGARGMGVHGLGSMAIGLQIAACMGFILVGFLIWMQIRFGGNGKPNAQNVAVVTPKQEEA